MWKSVRIELLEARVVRRLSEEVQFREAPYLLKTVSYM